MLNVLLFAALSPLSAAPLSDKRIHDAFNSWTVEALGAARAEWQADACLATAIFWSRPGHDNPPFGRLAGGEFYEFYFYSPAVGAKFSYHFLSPLQPSERGNVPNPDSQADKGKTSLGNAPRCITALPVSIDKAFELARKAGLTISPDLIYGARRDMFPAVDYRQVNGKATLDWTGSTFSGAPSSDYLSSVPRDREVWILSSYTSEAVPRLVSLVAIDAKNGRTLKVVRGASDKAVDVRR